MVIVGYINSVLDGVIVAIQTLKLFVKHYKFSKHLYLFTDGCSSFNHDCFDQVKQEMIDLEMQYILCDFSDASSESIHLLKELIKSDEDVCFHGTDALEQASKPLAKQVKPVTVFRGDILLGDTLKISTYIYPKTMEVKPMAGKKWSSLADRNANTSQELYGQVQTQRDFKGQETDTPFNQEDLIRAYKYGASLIPFSSEDEEYSKLNTAKELRILGFVKICDVNLYDLDFQRSLYVQYFGCNP